MGIMRGFFLVLASTLFLVAVFSSFLTFTLASSLEYGNVKTELGSLIKNISESQFGIDAKLNQMLPVMKTFCNKSSEYNISIANFTLIIPCQTILQGSNAVIDYGSEEVIRQIYYKDYQCSFLQCFSKQQGLPLFLISDSTRIFLIGKFYILLSASIALFILIFLLAEKKSNAGIIAGTSIIAAALPLRLLSSVLPRLLGDFSGLANIFFSAANSVFITGIIIGTAILVIGIIFKIFRMEMKIYNFLSKLKKKKEGINEERKEIPEEKKKEIPKEAKKIKPKSKSR